ncbi:unnamed protein product [Acanthosepion pharaonis]|uniref:Uncharacterized protein n=1 Tax=Acanthosepion pharaonis TaxID=158019 RepID=A0A812C2W3_ACAPH|nr:unnamed protein product [Sepia pharaonis]
MDLRHLFVASNDDEDVVSGVRSLGAELSGRLHESFTPLEEGHFVVTFPEWCQRSLNQLQKEIVDFKTWPPRELELQIECRLQDSNLGSIESIAVSDEDSHVFVVDGDDDSIKEFGETGEFVGHCPLRFEGFLPLDICCLSQDNFVKEMKSKESNLRNRWGRVFFLLSPFFPLIPPPRIYWGQDEECRKSSIPPSPASKFHPSLSLKLFFFLFSTLSSTSDFSPLSIFAYVYQSQPSLPFFDDHKRKKKKTES